MQNNNSKISYKVYARKSSESEDKQALSIESQIEEIKKFIVPHKINMTDSMVLQESKSAKKPYGRVQFEILVSLI
jgi:site-specific DNA recombinase